MNSLRNHVLFIWALTAVTVIVVVTGLYQVKSPIISEKARSDDLRLKHSRDIIREIDLHYKTKSELPDRLSDVANMNNVIDPSSKIEYQYRIVTSDSYELCMDFETEKGDVSFDFDSPSDPFATHKKGTVCATIRVEQKDEVPTQETHTTPSFSDLKADMQIDVAGVRSATFEFQFNQQSEYYVVDVSTDPQFNSNIYLEFAKGSSIPLIATGTDYYDFTCGTTLYWRVTSNQSVRSDIQEALVKCNY